MDSVALSAGPIHLGMDTSNNSIAVAVLRWGVHTPDVETIMELPREERGQPTPPVRVAPPSSTIVWPVIQLAWSESRNATVAPTSDGSPSRPSG
jgi:hypothetical protein